jgi:hypothetical protein
VALTLQKQTVNLVIDQGCTFEQTITAQNSSGGNVTISTGTTASKVRQSLHSSNNVYSFTTSVAGSNVTISMTATNTTSLPVGQYVYDIEYTQSDTSTKERLAEGIVTVSGEATK